ncbi:MAG: Molybdenum cofactor biosynthesis protein B [Alphaproteobacteria bacterium MarineAlpha6_Bin4]|nr:MAG: Molybdenum cofactor biosynthesis protein B [Alphaproteobacteria bacterium MarineAlpha6_Bin3]PPR38098.1 MAG: Molybdenum cofactor biosynthesis protein B [Alphaproteobacteria bacterium MarineAlpha6_Bin4]|tara:strand:+ start:25303 stop:25806 length:504 start_codon:yes stop_codon:yes gene_type:complete
MKKKLNIAILTVSDTRNLKTDKSGKLLKDKVLNSQHNLFEKKICKDNKNEIKKILKTWLSNKNLNVIIATGGTGLTKKDITPEVFKSFFEKDIPGFGEIFRLISFKKIKTSTIQSRACAGVSNGKYLFSLPGSPSACKDAWDEIIKYQLDSSFKPCNLVEIIPKLKK